MFFSSFVFFWACEFVATVTRELTAVTCSPSGGSQSVEAISGQTGYCRGLKKTSVYVIKTGAIKTGTFAAFLWCFATFFFKSFFSFFWTVVWTNWAILSLLLCLVFISCGSFGRHEAGGDAVHCEIRCAVFSLSKKSCSVLPSWFGNNN